MQSRDAANDSAEYYNRAGAAEVMRRLSDETLLMQGPMGSMLMSEPGAEDIPPAFWNLAEPQTVRRIPQLPGAAYHHLSSERTRARARWYRTVCGGGQSRCRG